MNDRLSLAIWIFLIFLLLKVSIVILNSNYTDISKGLFLMAWCIFNYVIAKVFLKLDTSLNVQEESS